MRHSPTLLLTFLLALLTLSTSCKGREGRNERLSESKMEDVLYDLHMAQGLALQSPYDSIDYYARLYRQEVFAKHDITEADFDSSMVWYGAHIDRLGKIYDALADRFGGSENDGAMLSDAGSFSGDTLNLWHGPTSFVLSSQGRNHFSYEQPADTAIRKDDRLVWTFNADWYYPDGPHQAYALMTITYVGDSVDTQVQPIFSQGEQSVGISVSGTKIKSIKCTLYQAAEWSERPRLLVGTRMKLLRVRSLPAPAATPTDRGNQPQGDSLDTKPRVIDARLRIRDSLLRADSAAHHGNHFR